MTLISKINLRVLRWILSFTLLSITTISSSLVFADGITTSKNQNPQQVVNQLMKQWAIINYQTDKKQQEKAFKTLVEQAHEYSEKLENSAEIKIWNGIILSTYAGAKGGLGALKYVKKAKKSLETALKLNPSALNGSAYTSLGSLYYQVPGWPIGFGSDKKAEMFLQQALSINPDGIDPNYFYADFLFEDGKYAKALQHANNALKAADRLNRPIADKGRREELAKLVSKIEKKMSR